MIGLLQQVYAKVTRADVVLYRWAAGEELVLDSKVDPWWGKPELSAGMRPAPSLWRPEWPCYSTLESGLPPCSLTTLQARVETVPQWVHDGEGNPEVVRFVRHARAEVCVPVLRGQGRSSHLIGVFMAISDRPWAFPAELVPALERFAHTASLWLKLVALHDDRRLWDRLLGRVTTLLPLLASAPNDDSFFAGLAALLSHGDGLEWNRVLIFSPVHPKESKVDLVYALGGIGHDHLERQKEFWERKVSLEELVRDRVAARAAGPWAGGAWLGRSALPTRTRAGGTNLGVVHGPPEVRVAHPADRARGCVPEGTAQADFGGSHQQRLGRADDSGRAGQRS